MTLPDAPALHAVIEATWPAFANRPLGPWTLRDGRGGGKRTSAATAHGPACSADLAPAEEAMRAMGARPRFMIRAGDTALDALLDDAGYGIVDPVNMYAGEIKDLRLEAPAPTASFHIWPPLAIQREIWAAGGIGPARVAVMERAEGARTALLGRYAGRAAATGFAAIANEVTMVHALEVLARHRRRGVARTLMAEAAHWAQREGAAYLAVICTAQNVGANALYSALGMARIGHYHYRQHPRSAPET